MIRTIYRQTSYDIVVLMKDTGFIRGMPIDGGNWTKIALTNDVTPR